MKQEMKHRGFELGELAYMYKQTKEDIYFEGLWSQVKPFAIKISKKYPSIAKEDRNSISMECLMDCCNNLKEGQNVLTLYGRILGNRLYDLWGKKMQSGKYKINSEAYSLEKLNEDVNYQPVYREDDFSIEMFNKECRLVKMEANLVNLIYQGYNRNEIRKKLELTLEEYNNLLETVKNKITNNYLEV